MNKQIVTPRTAAAKAAQQAAAAALILNRIGYHEQAEAIWNASKLALCTKGATA